MFGSQDSKRGAKAVSQEEWNDLNNALTNISIGDNNYGYADVSPQGINIPVTSFFHQHVAYIDENYTDAIIGMFREEDYYAYVDSLSIPSYDLMIVLNKEGGVYRWNGGQDASSGGVSVTFPTANTIAVALPSVNETGEIVSYSWSLVPEVYDVVFSGDLSTCVVYIQWVPGSVWDDDSQATLVNHDPTTQPGKWVPTFGDDTVTLGTLSEFTNDWLQTNDPSNYPITMGDAGDEDVYNKFLDVPIARFDFSEETSKLVRAVQLLFDYQIGGGSGGLSGGIEGSVFNHPFKGSVTDDTTITIGADRSDASYPFKDSITITDTMKDERKVITFAVPETIELDTTGTFKSYYVYYSCYRSSGGDWDADLEKSDVWPPLATVESAGNILKLIGYATAVDDTSYTWGQEMFDCPNDTVSPIIAEFEPYYELDGQVTISEGTVYTFNNNTALIAEGTYDLTADTEIWVRLTSTASSSTPSVGITGLLSGTYPGMYISVSDSVKQFNYMIGEISGGVYYPAHTGRLNIDNTMLMTEITDAYETLVNTPRMMMFKTTQVESVGLDTNDKLLDAKILDVQVRGGGIQQMHEDETIEFYGLTYDDADIDAVVYTGVDGDDFGEGSVTLTPKSIDYEHDHGLNQKFDFFTSLNDLKIEAGTKIRMEYAAGVASINAPDYKALQWLEIQNDTEIVHVNSPVDSESHADHWVKFTVDGKIDDGTEASLDLYYDVNGHLWGYDSTTQPPPDSNWRYEHCTDTITFADIILAAEAADDIILVDDECYSVVGETQDDATDPAPTVTDTYATCESCETDITNEYWKKCSDDTDVAILSANQATDDYAWLCIAAVWVKCYNDRLTAAAVDDPSVLEQCGTVPIECADLVGWPSSDDFGGTGCNSGAVADTNWGIRWTQGTNQGTTAISANALSMSIASGSGNKFEQQFNNGVLTGAFTAQLSVNWNGLNQTIANGQYLQFVMTMKIGGNFTNVLVGNNAPNDAWQTGAIYDFQETLGSTGQNGGSTTFGTSTLKLIRDGSNKVTAWYGGTSYLFSGTYSGNAQIDIQILAVGGGTLPACSSIIDNFILVDGSTDDILIDPTGDACV